VHAIGDGSEAGGTVVLDRAFGRKINWNKAGTLGISTLYVDNGARPATALAASV
jgi:hypothetical protein